MKKFLALLAGIAVFASAGFSAFSFTDLQEDDVYYNSINYLYDAGVVSGYDDGTFGSIELINRAEFLKIVVEASLVGHGAYGEVSTYGNQNCFKDVPANEWYTEYICYAKANKYIGGYSDGTYKPSQDVNFVEALKILMKVYEVPYNESSDPWYKEFVNFASEMNIIPLTITAFDQKITRGEMSDMMARYMHYEKGTLAEFLGDLKDIVVTYETISQGINMYPGASGDGGDGADDNDTGIVEPFDTYFTFDDAGNYAGINGLDLSGKSNFQALFEDNNAQIVGNYAIDKYDILYFAVASQGGDAAVHNEIIAYDYKADAVIVMYDEESVGTEESLGVGEKLRLFGMDLDQNVLVVQFEPYEYMMPLCWSPWVDDYENKELSLIEYNGLMPYTAPSWKVDEAQSTVDQCLAAM